MKKQQKASAHHELLISEPFESNTLKEFKPNKFVSDLAWCQSWCKCIIGYVDSNQYTNLYPILLE